MEATMLFLLWITTLVFTIEALAQPKQFTISLICFILWNGLAILSTTTLFVGFGSTSTITYSLELGDNNDTMLIWIFHMIGIFFFIYAFGNMMKESKTTHDSAMRSPQSPLRWL